jgi:hypothetical protein
MIVCIVETLKELKELLLLKPAFAVMIAAESDITNSEVQDVENSKSK